MVAENPVTSTSKKFIILSLVIVLSCLAVWSRINLLDAVPIEDEYFHLITAQSWMNDRQLEMLEGEYTRGALFTKLVGYSFEFFGDTTWRTARIFPSLVTGLLLVFLATWWCYRETNAGTALICACFLIFWPAGIEISQFTRFYALYGFLFLAGTVLIYYALKDIEKISLRRALLALTAFSCFYVSINLQVLTIVGLVGIAFWIGLSFVLPRILKDLRLLALFVALGVLAIIVFFSLEFDATLLGLWGDYRSLPPGWSYDVTFYHRYLRDEYPSLWPLFPLACVIALRRRPQLALLAISVFAFTFVVVSFGHRSHPRYMYSAMPFFFILWSIAIQSIWVSVLRFLNEECRGLSKNLFPKLFRNVVGSILIIALVSFAVISNSAFPRALRLAMGNVGETMLGDDRVEFSELSTLIQPHLDDGALVLTSRTMLTIAFLGDFDVAYSRLSVHDIVPLFEKMPDDVSASFMGTEAFVIDPRDGRPLIGDADEILRLVECVPHGVAVSTVRNRDFDELFFVRGRDLGIETIIKEGPNVRLIVWQNEEEPNQSECAGLPIPDDGGAAQRLSSKDNQFGGAITEGFAKKPL